MRIRLDIAAAVAVGLAAGMAAAQPGKEAAAAASSRCDKEVREYLETLKFIRQSAGSQIGDRVAAGYIAEDSLRKVQAEQGACAAAQLIREKSAAARR